MPSNIPVRQKKPNVFLHNVVVGLTYGALGGVLVYKMGADARACAVITAGCAVMCTSKNKDETLAARVPRACIAVALQFGLMVSGLDEPLVLKDSIRNDEAVEPASSPAYASPQLAAPLPRPQR